MLSIQEIKKLIGEKVSDEEAEKIRSALHSLAQIALQEFYDKKRNKNKQ